MFSQPASSAISEAYIAVRLLGGDDDTAVNRALRRRYGLNSYPSMLAMTHDGAVLTRSFERSVAGILSTMADAEKLQEKFVALATALGGKEDTASLRQLALLYKERSQPSKARALLERLTATRADVEDQLVLLEVLAALDDVRATQALLKTLIAAHADHADNIQWRIALALATIPTTFSTRAEKDAAAEQRVQALAALLNKTEREADQAQVRLQIGRLLNRTLDREAARAHWDWILEHARDSTAAPEALMHKATALYVGASGDVDTLEQVKVLLQEIVDKHPDHPAAEGAKRYVPAVQRSIDRIRAADEASKK